MQDRHEDAGMSQGQIFLIHSRCHAPVAVEMTDIRSEDQMRAGDETLDHPFSISDFLEVATRCNEISSEKHR